MSGSDGPPLPNPSPAEGARGRRKEPRWTIPFLRALVRTGDARGSAAEAGIDHTTAYARRKAHPEFASQWRGALAAHEKWKKLQEDEEIAAIKAAPHSVRGPSTIASSGNSPRPHPSGREELVVSGGKVRRVGHGRWSKKKEKIFFEELAATANIKMAADAVGVSTNAILARRHRSRLFAAKFDAVVQSAKVVIDLYLLEEAKKTFNPEDIDTGDVRPKVTIDQAIKISQRSAPKGRTADAEPDPFAEDAAAMDDDGIEAIRESIIGKLRRMREANRREQLKLGWTFDESFDEMIPPGYVQGPEYKPLPPDVPKDYYSKYRG